MPESTQGLPPNCPNRRKLKTHKNLVDVSDIFNFFLLRKGKGEVCSGRGRGKSEAPGGGSVFLLKIPGGGGFPGWGGEGQGGCLRRTGEFFGGGGG